MGQVIFKIGSLNFYTHGTFLVIAVVVTSLLMYWLAKRSGRNLEPVFDLAVFSLLSGIIFARITYFIIYRAQFTTWTEIFRIWEGGLVSWGGFVAGLICFLIIVRLYREPAPVWLDILGIAALAGIAIGRIGSFLSGELAGKPSSLPIAVRGALPVTLIEALIMFLAFFIYMAIFLKRKITSEGLYFVFILLFYAFVRFILDFWRVDSVAWLGLTYSQIVSAVLIIFITIYIIIWVFISRKGARYA
jgi:phosphatidylglycerol:prolipoprotein diacylglycerol transferase